MPESFYTNALSFFLKKFSSTPVSFFILLKKPYKFGKKKIIQLFYDITSVPSFCLSLHCFTVLDVNFSEHTDFRYADSEISTFFYGSRYLINLMSVKVEITLTYERQKRRAVKSMSW